MTDDIIWLEETDVPNDLEEYQTYTVVVPVENAYSNPNQGPGNHKLQYTDGTGTTCYLTLWANSTPDPVYDFGFEQDATYTLTEVRFTTNESGRRVFYNLNATEETVTSISWPGLAKGCRPAVTITAATLSAPGSTPGGMVMPNWSIICCIFCGSKPPPPNIPGRLRPALKISSHHLFDEGVAPRPPREKGGFT